MIMSLFSRLFGNKADANKRAAHEQALKWWRSPEGQSRAGKKSVRCDRCNAPLREKEGYLCQPMRLLRIGDETFMMSLDDSTLDARLNQFLTSNADFICETCYDNQPTQAWNTGP